MSCYEWENGEFIIPSSEWTSFKNKIRSEINELHVRQFEIAKQLYETLVTLIKVDKNLDIESTAFDEITKLRLPENPWAVKPNRNLSEHDELTVVWGISRYCLKTNRKILVRPTLKIYPKLGNNVTEFSNINCSVTFDNNNRKVYWQVPQNNHACDDARDTALGQILFKALGEVKWTKGTGGRIWGSDEYRDDANREDGFGSGSYEKGTWGPKEAVSALVQCTKITNVYNTYNSYRR